jgi:hypothetical protein
MIDYLHEVVALDAFTAKLSATSFTGAASRNAQKQALDDLKTEAGSALLGTLLQHLMAHSVSDGNEIALLQRASRLWAGGRDLCAQLGKVRADFENALETPGDPAAAARFNTAATTVQELSNTATAMLADIDSLRKDVMTFRHLLPHPRQSDLATHSWDWSNLTLGRRTDALVRNLFRAANSAAMTAFATGAISSYGANVVGSAYLGHAVGGPRRNHRFRDRLARNAVGNWLASHHAGTPSPAKLADQITFGPHSHPQLPAELQSLLHDALTNTFDLARTRALPDLQIGYGRLVTHLRLLDTFSRPGVPLAPTQFWMAALYGDPQNVQPSLRPQDVDVNAQDGGGATVTYGPPAPGSSGPDDSDSNKTASGCGIALLLIILVDLVQAFVQCIGQWANKHRCTFWDNMLLKKAWEQDPPDPRDSPRPENPNVTASRLTTISGSPQAISLVGQMFNVHCQAWEAMDAAYVFLAVTGLVYPKDLLTTPVYAQFTSLPAGQLWPHREEAGPQSTYHLYPSSPLENPISTPSPFGTGSDPTLALSSLAGDQFDASLVSLALWRQIAAGEQDSENRDLDADRGMAHPCWAAKGSVRDDPMNVVILQYKDQ